MLSSGETSDYFVIPGFEIGKVLGVPAELADETEMHVEYQEFDT